MTIRQTGSTERFFMLGLNKCFYMYSEKGAAMDRLSPLYYYGPLGFDTGEWRNFFL